MNGVRRREFLLAVGTGSLLVSLPAFAQQEKRMRRIGYFTGGSVQSNAPYLAAFRDGMAALRWIEGRDYVIDARYSNAAAQAGPGLAAELVATQPDLLLASGDTAARLLSERTKTIPIVFAIARDPVVNGLAASLQRPGGNVTGLTTLARDLGAKRLQLVTEAFPRVAQVVLLFEPAGVGSSSQAKEIEDAAARLRIRFTSIGLRKAADIEPAFKRGTALGARAYIVTQGLFVNAQRQAIVNRSMRSKVPTIFYDSEFVEAGGLMSYGPSAQDNFRRAAGYVDKILKGAKPGDHPIEQPIKFELVLNLKTAKAMGIKFPQSFLVRADRVIE
jgi:putative ABC transport system substrate-binding protein